MKRSILLALVAALALAVGVNASASASAGAPADAQTTAKKKAGKKKAGKRKAAKCKTAKKKGKARGKARRSLADGAQAKRKGKKKAARCKAKPKKKGRAKPKAGAFKLADGSYRHESESVTVVVTGGGTQARASFPLPCILFGGSDMPLTTSGDRATASERYDQPIAGFPSLVTWALTVRSTLDYTLRTSWDIGAGACTGQKTFSGRLVKAG